jgi:hypothetical protein
MNLPRTVLDHEEVSEANIMDLRAVMAILNFIHRDMHAPVRKGFGSSSLLWKKEWKNAA